MGRILAALASFACLIVLLCTDLDTTQRLLLTGVICFTAAANWDTH